MSRNEIINKLSGLNKEYEWLVEVPSQILQPVALNLSRGFLNFIDT